MSSGKRLPPPLSSDEITEALRIRATGATGKLGWRQVAKIMGTSEARLRRYFDPKWVAYRKNYDLERSSMLKLVTNEHYMPRVIPPPEVIDERNRRLGTPYQSIVAAMCGDPLPGYSALDRRANG